MDFTNAIPNANSKPAGGIDAFDKAQPDGQHSHPFHRESIRPVSSGESFAARRKATTPTGCDLKFSKASIPAKTLLRIWTFGTRALTYSKRDLAPFGLHTSEQLLSPFPPTGREYYVRLVVASQKGDDGIERNDVKRIDLIRVIESPAAGFMLPREGRRGADVNGSQFNVGEIRSGCATFPSSLVQHGELVCAYADMTMIEDAALKLGLSHFAYGAQKWPRISKETEIPWPNSWGRAGAVGSFSTSTGRALWTPWPMPAGSAETIHPALSRVSWEGELPIYFSGGKGFHVLVELAHNPPPAIGFNCVGRTFAETLAGRAEVMIDTAIFDVNRIVRLPNTKHPRTGLFKRRLEAAALFMLDVTGILELAKHPAGDGIPSVCTPSPQLAADWAEAERATVAKAAARATIRRDAGNDSTKSRAAAGNFFRFLVDFTGERHTMLFRCAAWLAEQARTRIRPSGPALLTEPKARRWIDAE